MRTPDIAIIGDHFMKPEFFVKALENQGFDSSHFRTHTLPWPDEPVEHGYAEHKTTDKRYAGMLDLREYQGDPAEISAFIGNAEVFITHLAPMPREMIAELARGGKLKLIGVSRGGPTNIDMQALVQAKIPIVNTPGRNASAVSEFTIGAILVETRLIRLGHEALKKGLWRGDLYRADKTGEELSELTIGIIGYGHIGRDVARLLRAFNATILVADPYATLSQEDMDYGVKQCELDTLLQTSDIVNISTRVTPETEKFMSTQQFNKMKHGAYFINVARGPLVDYDALYEALASGHLRGAMLDTFAVEPIPAHDKLLTLDNVTMTPHIAGASRKTCTIAAQSIAKDVAHYVMGRPCEHYVK